MREGVAAHSPIKEESVSAGGYRRFMIVETKNYLKLLVAVGVL